MTCGTDMGCDMCKRRPRGGSSWLTDNVRRTGTGLEGVAGKSDTVGRTGRGLEKVAGTSDTVGRRGSGLERVAGKSDTVGRTGTGLERQGENICDYLYLYTIIVTL